MKNKPMEISPNYSTEDWNALDLSNPTENNALWERAISIFEDRIRGRFIDIVDKIRSMPYSGFVVLAIDCLLIETLEQFYRGVPESVNGSYKFFEGFFKRSGTLSQKFDKKQLELFYKQFRCGILHQAEIKGDSLVKKGGSLVLNNNGNGITVNRQKFHELLVCEFNNYAQKLRAQDPVDIDLRLRFRAKMDYICRKPQYYFAFRADENDLVLQKQFEHIEIIGPATLVGWKVKTNKRGDWIGVEPDDKSNVTGNVYKLSVKQLDDLPYTIEKGNKPIPVKVVSSAISQHQVVWAYSR